MSEPIVTPLGFSHVRLTVTDIRRSKAFYVQLFGMSPGSDFSDQIDDPTIHDDPWRTYGGCSFTFGGQTLGLRPVAPPRTGSIPTESASTTCRSASGPSTTCTPPSSGWTPPASTTATSPTCRRSAW
ncbi:hypothetical protein QP157_03985 [Sphingomonas sp. LR61]